MFAFLELPCVFHTAVAIRERPLWFQFWRVGRPVAGRGQRPGPTLFLRLALGRVGGVSTSCFLQKLTSSRPNSPTAGLAQGPEAWGRGDGGLGNGREETRRTGGEVRRGSPRGGRQRAQEGGILAGAPAVGSQSPQRGEERHCVSSLRPESDAGPLFLAQTSAAGLCQPSTSSLVLLGPECWARH